VIHSTLEIEVGRLLRLVVVLGVVEAFSDAAHAANDADVASEL